MAVISGCESGKGEIQSGEGVYGLKRAIAVAGARSSSPLRGTRAVGRGPRKREICDKIKNLELLDYWIWDDWNASNEPQQIKFRCKCGSMQ